MTLYATVTSERDSREVKKGGNDYISVDLTQGNRRVATVTLWKGTLQVVTYREKGKDEKGQPLLDKAARFEF